MTGPEAMTDLIQPGGKGRIALATLVTIRWIALTGQFVSLLFVGLVLGYELDLPLLLSIVLVGALFNSWLQFSSRSPKTMTWRQTTIQLAFDVLHLALLLYLTGGIINPFVVLLLAPPVFAATVLPTRYSYGVGGLVLVCLSVLLLTPWPVPSDGGTYMVPEILKAGAWVALVITLGFTVLFVTRIATEAGNRSRALAATQLALAREQELASLGTLAAAAAHELGTPLGTIQLAASELEGHQELPADLLTEASLISQESVRCREILSRISKARQGAFQDPFAEQGLEAIMREAAAPHEDRGKLIDFLPFGEDQPVMTRRPELVHGLRNILENAVGFASTRVQISYTPAPGFQEVAIEDDGPGFDPAVLRKLGEPYLTTRKPEAGKDGGMGLGLFIAINLLERTGASLSFGRSKKGGARVVIRWPENATLPEAGGSGKQQGAEKLKRE